MLNQIITCAKTAGQEIMRFYQRDDLRVQIKNDPQKSPLTQADLSSHKIIQEFLLSLAPWPVVSEEDQSSWDKRNSCKKFWLVDPLDGTKDFLAKNNEFSVNIALVEENQVVLGVVYAPALDECYWAQIGKGAYFNGALICNNSKRKDKELIGLESRFHSNSATKDFFSQHKITTVIQRGSALKFCALASGSADVYPRFEGSKEWDTAAGQLIACQANCQVIDVGTKEPLAYNKKDIGNNFFIAARKDLKW